MAAAAGVEVVPTAAVGTETDAAMVATTTGVVEAFAATTSPECAILVGWWLASRESRRGAYDA